MSRGAMTRFRAVTFRRDSNVHEVESQDPWPIAGTTYEALCGALVAPLPSNTDLVTTCPKCLRRVRAEKEAPE